MNLVRQLVENAFCALVDGDVCGRRMVGGTIEPRHLGRYGWKAITNVPEHLRKE